MEISEDLYTWLRASNIIPSPNKHNKKNELSQLDMENFEYGCLFSQVLLRTLSLLKNTEKKILFKNSIDRIKPYKTSFSKKSNWSVIKSVLSELGIRSDSDDIELIKAGSKEALEQLLETIFSFEQTIFSQLDSEPTPEQAQSRYRSGELQIEAINGTISLSSTKTCLEFLLVSFCKYFDLHPKQAAGLLTQSGKYLAYICSRGFRGKHDIILRWLADMLKNSEYLAQLIINEEKSGVLDLVLTCFSHSLNSRNIDNVKKVCELLNKISFDLTQAGQSGEEQWTWFSANGIEACLAALKRFGAYVKADIVEVICTYAKSNFKELFTVILPEQLPEIIQYLAFMHELLSDLLSNEFKGVLESQQVIGFLIEISLEQAENLSVQPDERMTAINILCEIWTCTQIIDSNEEYSTRVVKTFEKISREKSALLKISCIGRLFNLLEHFTNSRNTNAPVIYKILTFALIENYSDIETKEFILTNFISLFNLAEIPLKILLEPLVKHLTISVISDFSVVDFHFFASIASSSQLTSKLGVLFLDSLAKLLLEHDFYSGLISEIMINVIKSFLQSQIFCEYIEKFLKVYLRIIEKMHFEGTRGKSRVLMKVVEECLYLKLPDVNESIEIVLCRMIAENRSSELNDWVLAVLEICGNPSDILEKYKKSLGDLKKIEKDPVKTETKPDNLKLSPKRAMRKQLETQVIEEIIKIPEKSSNLISIELFNNEELTLIDILKKSRKPILTEVFRRFSTKRIQSKNNTFEKINESVNTISDTEIFKFLKKIIHPDQMMTQAQFVEFSRSFCTLYHKDKSYFEFSEFSAFLAYISRHIFQKHPIDLSLLSPICSFICLIDCLETEFNLKKPLKLLSPTQDPPSGYKKIKIKALQVQFSIPETLSVPDCTSISFSILDGLLFALFNFHIIEPQILIIDQFKLQQDFQPNTKFNSIFSASPSKKKINKFEEQKLSKKKQETQDKKNKEKKRTLRVQFVKSQISKLGPANTQKKLEEKKKNEVDEEKKKMLIKRLEEKIERDRKARLEEIAIWKSQKEQETKMKSDLEKERLEKDREIRIKRRDEFIENEKIRLRHLSMEIAESKKKIPKIEASRFEVEKKIREKQIESHRSNLDIVRKQREENEKGLRELKNEFDSEAVQSIVKNYEKPLQLIFLHFCNTKHIPNQDDILLNSLMSFQDFHRFTQQFKIIPDLISKQEAKKMFIENRKGEPVPFESFKFLCFKLSKFHKSESQTSEGVLKDFIYYLEISKDVNSTRNLLRKKETLKYAKL